MSSATILGPIFLYRTHRDTPKKLSIFHHHPTKRPIPVKPFDHHISSSRSSSYFCSYSEPATSSTRRSYALPKASTSSTNAATIESTPVIYSHTYPLVHTHKVEGKVSIRLDKGKEEGDWELTVGCDLPGNWILHWGVTYVEDIHSEWDQPPVEMRPPGSVPFKDYAIETPLKKSSLTSNEYAFQEVKIDFNHKSGIAAINFVLKDVDTGTYYQHKGRDFQVPLVDYLGKGSNSVGANMGLGIWPGALGKLSNIFLKTEYQDTKNLSLEENQQNWQLEEFYEEVSFLKEVIVENSLNISVRKCSETAKNLLHLETNLPRDVVVHWGVSRDDTKNWELPADPYPPATTRFKNKALRTVLQPRQGGKGSEGWFTLDENISGFLFVLKLNEDTWFRCMGDDFFVPLPTSSSKPLPSGEDRSEGQKEKALEGTESDTTNYTSEIIDEIRNLVTDISSVKGRNMKTKEAQENILQEIEKLAAEAYSIFRSSVTTFTEEAILESEAEAPAKICSGTGTGFEILCQGFNWESHKSGKWYAQLKEKVAELSSLGITVIWLPPPTESVSPEGYMPKDLYNLNSRYGSIDELKDLVKELHKVGIKVLGDVVLNHRCAHYKNKNGVWNLFGGRLDWDDRAVVADDPHFQGRGNKSSGDHFHAAPNIDHSQEFVRKDIKEWLLWLRNDVGYDGWRLDFVRGFWGGYVKDYMDASEPYFAVGEYWDSLSYTYGVMDHNQDAHRQRIVDWINATNGTAGAFDVTTKGILHAALEKYEYWRLSDQKGKAPGVLGWWPSRAVTFIENHDTGSTQGHWRFPSGKEMQGYAYILTHPGTPSVFYDHIFSHYNSEISALLSLRSRNKLQCRSMLKITKAEKDVYAAIIDDKVAMKIGPGHYEPPNGSHGWSVAAEGRDYKVWEAS